MLTTVHNIHSFKSHVDTKRKCFQNTSNNAARVQQLFREGKFIKLLSIPSCIDDYNYFMSDIDIANLYYSYYMTQLIAQCN